MNPVPARIAGLMLMVPVLLSAVGCKAYAPRPLDDAHHRAQWLARSPADESVAALSARLADADSAAAAFDLADGVSCREAEAVALVFNAELRVRRLQAGVAFAGAQNAGLWADPVLGVDLTRIIQSVPNPWKVMSSLGLTIPISGRLEAEKALAAADHRVELARVAEAEWATRIDLRRAWLRWSVLHERADTLRRFADQGRTLLDQAARMELAGELSRLEAGLFRMEGAAWSADALATQSDLAEARLQVLQLMGLFPSAPVELVPAFVPDQFGTEVISRLDNNLELAALRDAYEHAEQSLRLEVRRQYPDLNIGPGYGREDGEDQVLLGLSVPLPVWNRNQRGVAEAEARRDLARAVYEAAVERLESGLAAATVRLDSARRHRQMLESELVPLADRERDDIRRLADLGEINTPLVLAALTRDRDVRTRLIEAHFAESEALILLQSVTGPSPGPAKSEGDLQ